MSVVVHVSICCNFSRYIPKKSVENDFFSDCKLIVWVGSALRGTSSARIAELVKRCSLESMQASAS